MTGLAGLWLPGFFNGKNVTGMAGVASRNPETRTFSLHIVYFVICFDPNLVAPTTSFHAIHQGHGLPVCCWHGFHRGPGNGVFPLLKLGHLIFMTGVTGFCGGDFYIGNIVCRCMPIAVTGHTLHLIYAVGR
jgi:hypothetical protein